VLAPLGLGVGLGLASCRSSRGDDAPAVPTLACNPDSAATPAVAPYKVTIPERQGLWIMDVSGEPTSRQLLARSLQGIVNRAKARIYLVDDIDDPKTAAASREANLHWLDVYRDQFAITPTGQGSLDDALAAFAPEIEGYLLASESEPWTFNAACTEAATRNAVVATSKEAAALEAIGIRSIASFVGRWPDAVTCYGELAARVGKMPYPGFAVMRTTKLRSRDFMVQQGILEIGGVPGQPEWKAVQSALTRVPPGVAIYGYTAEDGFQELTSVTDISAAGDVLVPSDSTPNLSFHMAVHPAAPTIPKPPADRGIDCASAELNVVIGLSDGDNQVVATTLYPTSRYWASPSRGRIPIAWSISPALATLAPAVLDYYARTIATNDELVTMIGAGYAYGSKMPDADWYFGLTFAQMQTLGLRVLWLFDPIESGGKSEPGTGPYSWQPRTEQAVACGHIAGVLDGYYPPLFHPKAVTSEIVGNVPLVRAAGTYDDGPAQIAARIRALLALPRAERPRVIFYSAAAWNNDITGLVDALVPLESEGARFVSASAGLACVGSKE
jgi:hypothetical protein